METQIHLYENPLGKSLTMYFFWLIVSVLFILELISETGLKKQAIFLCNIYILSLSSSALTLNYWNELNLSLKTSQKWSPADKSTQVFGEQFVELWHVQTMSMHKLSILV